MSMHRICRNCLRKEESRYNFGNDRDAERAFHNENWCDCGYESPEEMMIDQDMGFENPLWVRIGKYFLVEYNEAIRQGRIESRDELLRFFLKLLKDSAANFRHRIELVGPDEDVVFQRIYHGKTDHEVKSQII